MDTAVALVRSYLELDGYFVLTELPVRAVGGRSARDVTGLDILAIRFPHPASPGGSRFFARPLELFLDADPVLEPADSAVDVVIGEVKEGRVQVNPALWRREVLAFALRRLGCCPEDEVESIAAEISATGSQHLAMPGNMPCRARRADRTPGEVCRVHRGALARGPRRARRGSVQRSGARPAGAAAQARGQQRHPSSLTRCTSQ